MKVNVTAQYLAEQSRPNDEKYVFAYTVRIKNTNAQAAKLISRYWQITDAKDQVQEVTGIGVIGEQPRLEPGQTYTYTSGAILETSTGTMQGHYIMARDDGTEFEAEIPAFALCEPQSLH